MSENQDSKIITPAGLSVDSDWKAEARKEKERLASQSASVASPASSSAAAAAANAGSQARRVPPADFKTMVSQMVTQAMYAMGMVPDPQTGRRVAMLDLARYHVDMLGVLEEKTQGNLSDEETKLLVTALYELRMQYVQLSQQAIAEQTGSGAGDYGG